ncbi:LysM peptidoglycan-binding domain-containing protein [Hoeflea sp. YIM 152468]|uniref:LysM peptidoglycan-binding domain-containing protein n=1 Tax=Hoeflea sp. YIM 152468 TaxID=3031759 RepID=UPI0023DA63F2|nr:LysM peptidoglycan-binding domain-containing protein [Hoeflea sp. YIM 152468]MDF1607765.1 LysM peptidoglycan-binding domain-containing protein [Hoeflea sp. YIM 152468]
MNKTNAGFLVFLGMSIVVAIGAFFFAPDLFKPDQEIASLTPPGAETSDAPSPSPVAPVAEQPDTTEVDPDTTEAEVEPTASAFDQVAPSFDVLRVEPDGSTVIAGKAAPNTTLDIMNGETVIASTRVGPNGDFAAVLDQPLAAGDYQLTLRSSAEDGSVLMSEEVATVSVPETASGELLAMVSKPGKASRIIAQPAAPAEAQTAADAAVTPDADVAGDPASVETADVSPPTDEPVTAGEDQTAADGGAANEAADAGETAALAEKTTRPTPSAPETATDTPDTPAAADPVAVATGEEEVAMVSPETVAEPAQNELPAGASVHVDAVEIEGDKIFIAGSATPGFEVRVTADGILIGTSKADETGRFIVEAVSALSVGDHMIHADLMDKSGKSVLRATVPFNRPAGDSLAAVALVDPAASRPESQAGELILPDIASLSELREEAFEAVTALKDMVSAAEAPEDADVSSALEDTVAKLKAAATADLPADSSDAAKAVARSMRDQAQSALASLSPDQSKVTSATDDPARDSQSASMTGDLAGMSETLERAATALSEPAEMAPAAPAMEPQSASTDQPGEPKTIVQAPLASTPGAVIIRRGDTLWQISRRTYGEGVRYTTIYVANRSQIQNPDRIRPGQVFSVPETPLDNAEEIHQRLLGVGKSN